MHADLERISRAARAAREAQTALQALVATAAHQVANAKGADTRPLYTLSDIASAAGVTRQTMYRWAAADGGDPGERVDVRAALSDALILLSTVIGPTNAGTVRKRAAHGDIAVMIRGLDIGMQSLPPEPPLGDGQRAILAHAQIVRAAAERHHAVSGRWPNTVALHAAAATTTEMKTSDVLAALNEYDGENIWEDVVYALPYDEQATALVAGPEDDDVVISGQHYRYEAGSWRHVRAV